jgi:hypothetical protein
MRQSAAFDLGHEGRQPIGSIWYRAPQWVAARRELYTNAERDFREGEVVSLYANLVKRVQRLPKPARTSDALQPTFEAISNAIHAIYARWGEHAPARGNVEVFVGLEKDKSKI